MSLGFKRLRQAAQFIACAAVRHVTAHVSLFKKGFVVERQRVPAGSENLIRKCDSGKLCAGQPHIH